MSRRPVEPEQALYVKLPANAVEKLRKAAQVLGVHKKDLVAGLVTAYVDPDTRRGLSALGAMMSPANTEVPRKPLYDAGGPTLGAYAFQAYDAPPLPEVMNAEQAAQLLQLEAKLVIELADAGELPGRKLGVVWRFSRTALLAWLADPTFPTPRSVRVPLG